MFTSVQQNKTLLPQIKKGALLLVLIGIFTYFTGGFIGGILRKFYPDLSSGLIGTREAEILFGTLIIPTFYLSFFIFLLKKEDSSLKKFFAVLLILVVLLNLIIGISSIIFSAIFIALGYALAKFIRWLIASRAKA